MAAIELPPLRRRLLDLAHRAQALDGAGAGATRRWLARLGGALGGLLAGTQAAAADLPDDRADLLYHLYDGGGVTASGPAVLVRKRLGDAVALSASYYVDMVSNASIDVVTTASPYHEKREEMGVGLDYAVGDALVSGAVTSSKEPDYHASSASLDVAQDLFGGMTTLRLGYTRGWDDVFKHGDPAFAQTAGHWQYRLGLTQILTSRLLASANLEAVSDAGFLGSPYRAARVLGAAVPEVDPGTRTSRAATLRLAASVTERSAVRAEARYFWDTWGVRARTAELGGSQYVGERWLLDAHGRYYTQQHASFYSNDFSTQETYMSRNRQLSDFHDVALGARVTWTAWRVPGRYDVRLNAAYERISFHYSDFTDIRTGQPYAFGANVAQLFVSATF